MEERLLLWKQEKEKKKGKSKKLSSCEEKKRTKSFENEAPADHLTIKELIRKQEVK